MALYDTPGLLYDSGTLYDAVGSLTGLKALMDFNANAATNALNTAIDGTAQNPTTVTTLSQTISNPPTQAQVQAIQNKLNELINAITRSLA